MDRDNEDKSFKDGPFDDAEERQGMRSGNVKAHKTWKVAKPALDLIELWPILWKVLGAILAFIIWWENGGSKWFHSFPGGTP